MFNLLMSCVVALSSADSTPKSSERASSKPLRRMVCRAFDQWCVEKWTTEHGLPGNRVTRILFDAQGQVSCTTRSDAAVWDGQRWKATNMMPINDPAWIPDKLPGVVPFLPVTRHAQLPSGVQWIATPQAVCRWDGQRWRVYHGRRWLPGDRVNDIGIGPGVDVGRNESVWVATDGGVARIHARRMTLADKADHFQRILRRRHVRRGLIGGISLSRPGRFDDYRQPSDDNDGLWTSLYVAAESFRYAVTRNPDAKANATESLDALLFLEQVTSLPGFVARSYMPRGQGPQHGGIWYPSKDGQWDWKGDTSSDELDGHFFAYGIYYDLVDDAEAKRRVAATARRVMDRIIEGGYKYHGPGGRRTRWGMWAPHELNRTFEWRPERGLNSLGLLAYLKVTHHLTGDPKYHDHARKLIEEHGYARNTINLKINLPGMTNHSDDELAFLSYYSLLRLERDPALRKIYTKSIERSWRIERPEHSPFFNFVYGSTVSGGFDLAESVEWLRDFPLDLVRWGVDNRGRRDLKISRAGTRFGRRQAKTVLPPSERRLMRWNGNPYAVDGDSGGGSSEDDGAVWLLPYWMGRYHGFIVEAEGEGEPGSQPIR